MEKTDLHPRSRHRGRYDFPALIIASTELALFVAKNAHGDDSIDFADPKAVLALNRAILKKFYDVSEWSVPEGYLCPPIPGRADTIHYIADLLAEANGGEIPRGPSVRVLDIGTGANGVYPLIGNAEYGWSFVGTEVDANAIGSLTKILAKNPDLKRAVQLRHQPNSKHIFNGVVTTEERFDVSICNPPFHASAEEAEAGSRRKWKNLGKEPKRKGAAVKNFGGTNSELWCPGGEREFIARMVEESVKYGENIRWFTTLVSKEAHLPKVLNSIVRAKAKNRLVVEMAQGQKKSRIVAWTFQGPARAAISPRN